MDMDYDSLVAGLQSKDHTVSARAHKVLEEIQTGDIEPLLIQLRDHDPGVRRNAVSLVALRYGDVRAMDGLIDALRDDHRSVREAAAEALGKSVDERAVCPLIQALQDECKAVRIHAAQSLGKQHDPRAVEPLIEEMHGEQGYDRGFAAIALGLIGDRRATDALLNEFSLDDQEDHVEVVDSASEALGMLKDPASYDRLVELLRAGIMHVRAGAAYVLGELGDSCAVPSLRTALNDTDGWVSRAAASALAKIDDPGAMSALIDALLTGAPKSRESAARALGKRKPTEAADALICTLGDPEPSVRRSVASALAAISNPSGNDALLSMLARHDLDVVCGAFRFFIRKGIAGSEDVLIQALMRSGDDLMAECFITSCNPLLAEAGREHHRQHGVVSAGSLEGIPLWGSDAAES